MNLKRFLAPFVVTLSLIAPNAFAGKNLEYKDGDLTLEGYLSEPNNRSAKKAPAVLIVHQWKGLGEYEKSRADMLAKEGFVTLAVDIYGKGIRPNTFETARKEAGIYKGNRSLYRQRLMAAYNELKKNPKVDHSKIVVMGYCFGGTGALELARSGALIAGAASFHGGLDNPQPQDAKNIKGSVVAYHGAIDPYVSPKEVEGFLKEMNEAKVDYQFVSFANAVHSFTEKAAGNDNSKGAAYNELADKRSWTDFLRFAREVTSK